MRPAADNTTPREDSVTLEPDVACSEEYLLVHSDVKKNPKSATFFISEKNDHFQSFQRFASVDDVKAKILAAPKVFKARRRDEKLLRKQGFTSYSSSSNEDRHRSSNASDSDDSALGKHQQSVS